jgi:hypothetical protein
MQEKYGFVYLWYDKKHKRFYIGCRWGREDDGYICSSPWMKKGYKLRPLDFKRRILKTNIADKSKLLEEEYRWLSKIKNDELGKRYYNIHNHHFGHWMMNNHYEKKHHPMYGKNHTEETKQKMRGKKVTEETKQKLREISKKQFLDLENRKRAGIANVGVSRRKGISHTEETKKKMSVTRKGRIPWNKGLKTGKGQKEYKMENIE